MDTLSPPESTLSLIDDCAFTPSDEETWIAKTYSPAVVRVFAGIDNFELRSVAFAKLFREAGQPEEAVQVQFSMCVAPALPPSRFACKLTAVPSGTD
jgi:hypothetical protein